MKRVLALAVFPLIAADAPHLFYSKSFPRSSPAYVEITIDHGGAGEYKEAPDDPQPLQFQLSPAEINQMFTLADKLGRFTHPLEAPERPVKVAFMGMKTFRFVNGAENHEVKFNYSEDSDARQLQDWFERITETEQHRINLERAARYDKLGVNQAMLLLQSSFDHKRLVAAEQLLPVLDRIANNETYVHIARVRAAGMADAIRAGK